MQIDLDEILSSESFRNWSPDPAPVPQQITLGRGRSFVFKGRTYKNLAVNEKHFSCAELASAWGVSVETVRQIFRAEPGVLRLGTNGTRQTRGYITLRIPQSVAVRVHTRLSALPQTR